MVAWARRPKGGLVGWWRAVGRAGGRVGVWGCGRAGRRSRVHAGRADGRAVGRTCGWRTVARASRWAGAASGRARVLAGCGAGEQALPSNSSSMRARGSGWAAARAVGRTAGGGEGGGGRGGVSGGVVVGWGGGGRASRRGQRWRHVWIAFNRVVSPLPVLAAAPPRSFAAERAMCVVAPGLAKHNTTDNAGKQYQCPPDKQSSLRR